MDSLAGAIAAERGGADRIELCRNLSEGGLTPDPLLVRQVVDQTTLPVMVMIRPRGGSFVYSARELARMLADLDAASQAEVQGFVFGALTDQHEVDESACRLLWERAQPRSTTFHRAFDDVADVDHGLKSVIALGFDRILSSGRAASAVDGIECLAQLVQRAAGRISIMPGSGVRPHNVARILQRTGAGEIHSSAPPATDSPAPCPSHDTSLETVRRLRQAIDAG